MYNKTCSLIKCWGLGFLSFVYSQCSQHLSATTKVQQTLSSQFYLSIQDLKVNMKQALLTKVKHVAQIKAVLVIRIKVKQIVWIKVEPVTQIKAEPVVQIM